MISFASSPLLIVPDQHFTPVELAVKLIEHVRLREVKLVADFAVGKGDLLRAVRKRWPTCALYGVDRDVAMVKYLCKHIPDGEWVHGDFLTPHVTTSVVAPRKRKFDLAILNPPFSIRGGGWVTLTFHGRDFKCSAPIAFIAHAAVHVRRGGAVVSIVPHGVLHSDRDQPLLAFLQAKYNVTIVEDRIRGQFKACDVRCAIIVLYKRPPVSRLKTKNGKRLKASCVQRGNIDHVTSKGKRSRAQHTSVVLHTSNLRDGKVAGSFGTVKRAACGTLIHAGPVIAFPRVGRINPGKIALIRNAAVYAFTRCVLLIKCGDIVHAEKIRQGILGRWNEFQACYGGTGASYTTIKRIEQFVAGLD